MQAKIFLVRVCTGWRTCKGRCDGKSVAYLMRCARIEMESGSRRVCSVLLSTIQCGLVKTIGPLQTMLLHCIQIWSRSELQAQVCVCTGLEAVQHFHFVAAKVHRGAEFMWEMWIRLDRETWSVGGKVWPFGFDIFQQIKNTVRDTWHDMTWKILWNNSSADYF